MKMTLYTSGQSGNAKNCLYPNKAECAAPADLQAAVAFDHVCAAYKGNYRSVDNFLSSDCLVMDCDNDHAEDPDEWITPESLSEELASVPYAITYSRNHMKVKDGKSARPRFHVYFQIPETKDADAYAMLKKRIQMEYPFFDDNALDAGRFIFGAVTSEVIWHDGAETIDQMLASRSMEKVIPEGRRNATMSRIAGKLVKRYGATETAYKAFMEHADKCDPPLDDEELNKIWASARRFAKKVQSQEGYIPPEEFGKTGLLKPSDYSDIGQAKVLTMDCANELTYTAGTDFLVFKGTHWHESRQQAVGVAERFLDRQLLDANTQVKQAMDNLASTGVSKDIISAGGKALEKAVGDGQKDAYLALMSALAYRVFVMKRRDMKYITSALQASKPMIEIDTSLLDADENLLTCPDGTYDLRKGLAGRKDHDASDLITKCTAFAPGEKGKDLWLDCLDKIFQNDAELIDYVQQTVGLGAIGAVYQEALIIAYGEGSNGKSTFWNTVSGALGSYSGMVSADTLTVGCRRNVKPELAEVKGKRLIIAAELEEGQRMSTSIVKQLSSTDELEAEKKYKDPFKFRPTHTPVLYTNHLPKVGALDHGIWRRLIVIPFNARISGSGNMLNYSKYLLENAGPYVMKWIIEGAEKAIKNNHKLKEPKKVTDAIEQYRRDNDWMSHFLEECCEIGDGLEEKSGELYASYRAFCARTGEFARSTTEFYATLEKRGFTRHKRKSGRFVLGLQLSDAELDF